MGGGSESPESWPPDHQGPMDSDKALTRRCVEMSFHIETESSEASKVFIRRKNSTVRVDRHTGGLRERVAPLW